MAVSPEVNAQLARLKSIITSTKEGNISLAGLELTAPDFSMTKMLPSPPSSVYDQSMTVDEWLYAIRYFESHLVPILTFRDFTDLNRTFFAFSAAALQAKASFSGSTFGSGLYIRGIRPATVYANGTTTTPTETWNYTATAGWTSPLYTINLNKSNSNSGAAAANTLNNVAMVVLAVTDLAPSPKLLEYQWTNEANQKVGVISATELLIPSSTGINIGEQTIYIDKNKQWILDANFSSAGASIPALIGAEFVTPALYTQE